MLLRREIEPLRCAYRPLVHVKTMRRLSNIDDELLHKARLPGIIESFLVRLALKLHLLRAAAARQAVGTDKGLRPSCVGVHADDSSRNVGRSITAPRARNDEPPFMNTGRVFLSLQLRGRRRRPGDPLPLSPGAISLCPDSGGSVLVAPRRDDDAGNLTCSINPYRTAGSNRRCPRPLVLPMPSSAQDTGNGPSARRGGVFPRLEYRSRRSEFHRSTREQGQRPSRGVLPHMPKRVYSASSTPVSLKDLAADTPAATVSTTNEPDRVPRSGRP